MRRCGVLDNYEQEISGPKPIFTHVNGSAMLENYRKRKKNPDYRYGQSFYLRTTARHIIRMVDKSDVEKMTAFCRENYPLSLQVLFFMGVRTSIARLNKREKDVSLFTIAARRATLEEKMAGGTRALALPFRTIMEENLEFKDALTLIMDKQNILYRHADYDTMDIFKLMRTIYGCPPQDTYFPLHFTFQPVPMVVKDEIQASTKWYCNGTAATNLSLAIMDGDGTGSLRCYYEYHDKVIQPETLNKFHDAITGTILAGVENPHIQLKDLLDMPL